MNAMGAETKQNDRTLFLRWLVDKWSHYVVWIQGSYFVLMGLWPLLSIVTFQHITGPKTDLWLVKTVGVLLIMVGAVLILAAYRRRIDLEMAVLGIGTALALITIEIIYVFSGLISAVYLGDTLIEIFLIIGWFRRGGPLD